MSMASLPDHRPTIPARPADVPLPVAPPGTVPNLRFSFADVHNRLEPGGWVREVTVRELPVGTTLAGVNMRLDTPGGIARIVGAGNFLLAKPVAAILVEVLPRSSANCTGTQTPPSYHIIWRARAG